MSVRGPLAVTDPPPLRTNARSMFVVPVDAPRVRLVRDVATMEHPEPRFGVLGGHTEIV